MLGVGYAAAGTAASVPIEVRRFPATPVLAGPVSRQPVRPDFHVVGLVTGGSGRHEIDFRPARLAAGAVFWVRPGQVHHVVDHAGLHGVLLLFTGDVLVPGTTVAAFADSAARAAQAAQASQWRADPRDALTRIGIEHLEVLLARGPDRRDAADALRLALAPLVGAAPRVAAGPHGPPEVFTRFAAAVEAGYARHHHVLDYVPEVHASARTIDRAVRQVTGGSAKRFLDDRIALEARRRLTTSDTTVAALSQRLGFVDASNFVKFYRRMTGRTPGADTAPPLTSDG
ncbi:AraC family transcriptional regulator [Actinacidiphila reveromycinica]|uniref:AraC family transcriptional regulator n=1 Tax=Actinacidiphila reveromycinica TaxID=659352 RepID=UPI0019224065|nr:helix-turn-helix transcriptional regulator [Streptomyces sp. SN-593]